MGAKQTDVALRTGFVALYALVFVSVLYWSYQLEGTNPWQGWTYVYKALPLSPPLLYTTVNGKRT